MEEAHYDVPWEFVHRKGLALRNERPRSACAEAVNLKQSKEPVVRSTTKEARAQTKACCLRQSKDGPQNKTEETMTTETKPSTSSESKPHKGLPSMGRSNAAAATRRDKFCEHNFIHSGVDRMLAEDRLMNSEVGTFLLRLRQNNSLALSIRATHRVLHIKLELRSNRWVLGEGPSFGSVSNVINFYRTHELPVRGAEHVVLTTAVLAL